MNFMETVLNIVANLASESTSCIGFYEPKVPQKLIKQKKKKSRRGINVQIFCREYRIHFD